MNKEKEFTIVEQDLEQLKQYDLWFREHHLIAKMMRERIVDMQHYMLNAIDPALAERAVRGFVEVNIDWERKVLIVTPTADKEKKAEEAEALMEEAEKNVENAG